ncbi:UDP-2,4-diacetamido-2,4,6-trideoxy-beta-L-altropyranose hydrolase [Tardiphaga alba]|nr:UDP-2,4-diacetamido-2,4,6-trideoxy-beta-L-altropyranose hydrolase [Tardiphaga alba]
MRCLTAAEAFSWAGWTCGFSVNAEAIDTLPALRTSGYRVEIDENERILLNAAHTVVIDNYALDAHYERRLRTDDRQVIVFDDLQTETHACDILLDPTPGRVEGDYSSAIDTDTTYLLGAKYALISSRWRACARTATERLARPIPASRILVSMGATDPSNATGQVLAALKIANLDVHIDIVLGSNAPHLKSIQSSICSAIALHIDPPDLPTIAASADFAIGAAGTSSFERAILGLPAILLQTADNQKFIADAFSNTGAALTLPSKLLNDSTLFAARIAAFAMNRTVRAAMSRAAATMTDGRGASRLLLAVATQAHSRKGGAVRLRLAEPIDRDWLLDLQHQPKTRKFSNNSAPPPRSSTPNGLPML